MSQKIIFRANLVSIFVLLGFVALIGMITWDRMNAAQEARRWTMHTYDVLADIRSLLIAVREAEDGQRGYLLSGSDPDMAMYDAAVGRASILLGEVQQLTADNTLQQSRLRILLPQWQRHVQRLAQAIQVRNDRGLDAAAAMASSPEGRAAGEVIIAQLTDMMAEEQRLLAERLDALDSRGLLVRWLVAIGGIVVTGALLVAYRMINIAWQNALRAEALQRSLASRLRAALDSLSQGVAVFGPAHRLRHWNGCFQVLLGLPDGLLAEETPYAAFVEETARNGSPLLETEPEIEAQTAPNGEAVVYERWTTDEQLLELRRTPTPEGGFVLTVSDLTKRAQSEALLRDSQKMQAIGQLTGGIAHDFNNLLTVIIGNLELARTKPEPQERLAKQLDRALWAAQRGGTLTSQLLAFARKQPLAPAPIDLSEVVPAMIPLLRRTLGEPINVLFADTAGLWPAMADPAQLESAVLNLALNARDAMPGGGRLTIELANKVLDADYARRHTEVTAGEYVMIAVTDTGHGMAADVIARAFEPFFTTKSEGRGTGLGLAMVFGFVKQSGGHVKIYSEPNEGTSVKIYLPRAAGVELARLPRMDDPVELPTGSATILVVEDELGVREITVAILRSLGYRVLEAADGDAGLLVFGAHAPEIDLLLTDVVLPGKVRGRELADQITAMRPDLPVLFMSGYTENAIVHHGRLDDGVQLLGKPFKREQLARKVAEVLGAGTIPASGVGDGKVVDLRGRKRE